jgi:ketosteroid isomerase-like protein
VTEFLKLYPDVSIEMLVNDRVVDLLEGKFDVGVRIGRLRDSSLIARRIAPIRLAAGRGDGLSLVPCPTHVVTGRTVTTAVRGEDMNDIKQELEKISSAYMECFNRQDAAGIAALYANGGMHINPAAPRTDIEQLYHAIFKAGFDHQQTNLDDAWPLGTDAALATGQYRITGRDPTGAPMELFAF